MRASHYRIEQNVDPVVAIYSIRNRFYMVQNLFVRLQRNRQLKEDLY